MACFPKRYIIAILLFFGMMLLSVLESAFILTYLDVVKEEGQNFDDGNFAVYTRATNVHFTALLLSFAGGILSHKYGGATITGIGIALSAFINIMTPFTPHLHVNSLMVIKFLDGFLQAISYCGMADIWARWYPMAERSKAVAFVLTGSYATSIIHQYVFQYIAKQWSQRAVFGIFGSLTAFWAIIWLLIVRSDPAKDESLSNDEKDLLAQRFKYLNNDRTLPTSSEWKQILKSAPIWTLLASTFIFGGGSMLYISFLSNPMAMSEGFMVAYLLAAGCLADYGRNTKFTPTKIHKLFICMSFGVGALLLVACTITPRVVNFVTYIGVSELLLSFTEVSILVNGIDLAPKYACLINGFQTSVRILGTITIRWLYEEIIEQREIIFIAFAVLYVFGALLYYFLSSGEVQQWNNSRVEVHEMNVQENHTTV